MKIVALLLSIALLVITGILVLLIKDGGALRSAGVIGATEVEYGNDLIPNAVALRLFPEFQEAKNVIWYIDSENKDLADIPQKTHFYYQNSDKPELIDLRDSANNICIDGCWYIQEMESQSNDDLLKKINEEPSIEIYVQYFDRDEPVPEHCEKEKILKIECLRPISAREIRRKIKTAEPHFFMRRYLQSKFYLFIEQPSLF